MLAPRSIRLLSLYAVVLACLPLSNASAAGSPLKDVKPGVAIDGLPGAVWADNNSDGQVDGFVHYGQYYAGVPQGYDPKLRRVTRIGSGDAVPLAGAGAVIPGLSVLEGAVVGAAVGGLAGANWVDRDNDGRVDGYIYNGQYYSGAPVGYAPLRPDSPPILSDERG